jgi:hypothetical protein
VYGTLYELWRDKTGIGGGRTDVGVFVGALFGFSLLLYSVFTSILSCSKIGKHAHATCDKASRLIV